MTTSERSIVAQDPRTEGDGGAAGELFPGLYAFPSEPLPFAPALHIRAFLLRRAAGNVLIYGAPRVDADAAAALGGIERAYLNHWHEAGLGADLPGVPLFVHEADRAAAARKRRIRGTFSRRHTLDGDFEVIPTPGHTPGATAFLWDSGEHRFLFTGDTVYLRDGEWVAAVLDSSDRGPYLDSLALLRELDFDVLVPWGATGGQPPFAVTDRDDPRRRIDAIAARVRAGGDR
jgi:glyoxylase-like metal-dependent hydrolase (beta-lactamase superfamily II)